MIRIDAIWLATEPMGLRAGYRNGIGPGDRSVRCGEAALRLPLRQSPGQPDESTGARWRERLA